ncbi:heme-dependent oxidative N-demethylase family protein [Litorisediminicola beolgyonensis]|uniref:DUF3445 domain-containing protein n=1 Tax=Litorisediminicola beolgyonensis TaxID=1173614 RepID=A0ABW3ZF04_9RHOB
MILQTHIPYDPRDRRRLPGIQPLGDAPWLLVDDAYPAQMAERDRLIAGQREAVIALDPDARPAADELLETVLASLPDGFSLSGGQACRPDGVEVPLDRGDPLGTLGRLVQEDLCLIEKRDGPEHLLTGAVLCFPARWSLAAKMMRPLTAIHEPVAAYDDSVAPRVQRLFDGVQPGCPIWRYNALATDDPTLFQPQAAPHATKWQGGTYMRSERQVVMRLPETRAAVFSIHSYMIEFARLEAIWG